MSTSTHEMAQNLNRLGLPITICQGKSPVAKDWQSKEYLPEHIHTAYTANPDFNVGVVWGERSGIIDFECDSEQAAKDFEELFAGIDVPATPEFKSRRGKHWLFAFDERLDALGKAVLKFGELEIRAGGGGKAAHSLVPPSRTDGFTREWIRSLDDCQPANLPDEVVERILRAQAKVVQQPTASPSSAAAGDRPGDDFNQRAEWPEILEPHGWTLEKVDGEAEYWKRPGKLDDGHSASTGYCKTESKELFFCFSSNAKPFEVGSAYDKFAVYTHLNHDGNFSLAAGALAAEGYGKPSEGESNASDATRLVQLASATECFHEPAGKAYATVPVNEHFETMLIESPQFKQWLQRQFYLQYGRAVSQSALASALGVIHGQAMFDGPEHEVHVRLAAKADAIYLDLANDAWEVVEVTRDGWKVISQPPVKFRRPTGLLPLPRPERGGAIAELRQFVNVTDGQWPLYVTTLLASLRPTGPYPVAIFNGEQGSAKTTTATVLRSLTDPNQAMMRSEPASTRDLMIAAHNSSFIALDNLSGISGSLSDALCRLSTGGGFACRSNYTDADEAIFNAMRPVLLNGIDDIAQREDLLDRAILFDLPPIPEDHRKSEAEFWANFEEAKPRILGCLLTALSDAMRRLPETTLPSLPRLADFALFATAAEESLGLQPGEFLRAFDRNREATNSAALDNPVAQAITSLLSEARKWIGTATELLQKLESSLVDDRTKRGADWPKSAAALSRQLNRLAATLRQDGIEFESWRSGQRYIRLRRA